MPLAETDIDYLRNVVAEHSGHMVASHQGYLFESRLRSLALREGYDSVEAFVTQLRRGAQPRRAGELVAQAMTINETFFFRDGDPFETLRKDILPQLIERRQKQRQLRIWSAACSTGQEPYSLALTLREHFPQLKHWDLKILATDLSDEVLSKARQGSYTQFEVNRGLPTQYLLKHFTRRGVHWEVHQEIKDLIEFRKLNLAAPWPAMTMYDIVFVRNVLIYFSQSTKEDILHRMWRSMSKDGCLVLGGGETLINLNTQFKRESLGNTVYYRPTS